MGGRVNPATLTAFKTAFMFVTYQEVEAACEKAFIGHKKDADVAEFKADYDYRVGRLYESILNETYHKYIKYKKLVKNNNGKKRSIDSPNLDTRILEYVFIFKILKWFQEHDPGISFNCKPGYSITCNNKKHSLCSRMKWLYYDRLDLHYILTIDMRKCYEHIRSKVVRKVLLRLGFPKDLVQFCIDTCMVNHKLPVGTPSSSYIHHLLLLDFDQWLKNSTGVAYRFSDNVAVAQNTLEECQTMKWRIRNKWWYDYQIRAKVCEIKIQSMDLPLDFCGYVFNRNNKPKNSHNKGFTKIRGRTKKRALKKCRTREQFGSYFGILKHGDCFNLIRIIQSKNMKFQDLVSKVKIKRPLDSDTLDIEKILGMKINVRDYLILQDKDGNDNWIRILFDYPELDEDGKPTGMKKAGSVQGGHSFLIEWLRKVEVDYPNKEFLPLTGASIVKDRGYLFEGSNIKIEYFDD